MGVARVSELAKWLNLSELSPLGGGGSQCDPELFVGGEVVCVRLYPSWIARPHLHLLGRSP